MPAALRSSVARASATRCRPTNDGQGRVTGAELWTVTPKGTIAAQATATLA